MQHQPSDSSNVKSDAVSITTAPDSTELDTETAELLWNAMVGGATLKDIQGIPEDVMEGLYAHAYEFYQQGRVKDAEVFFRFLCTYDTYNADYMIGLAATLQQQKQYDKAIDAYTLAFSLNNSDLRPMLHIGQCHLFLKNKKHARNCFSAVTESGTATAALKEKAQAYLASIKLTNTEEKSHV